MRTTGYTHVSINAHDLDESVRFYQELFGMEEVPAPDFPFSIRWLRVGDLQLHLVESEESAPGAHHFALEVDDFEAAYKKARELGITYESGYFSYVYELPDGAVQLYVRDPSENMVEINWPDITTLDRSVITEEIHKVPAETEEAAKATLYLSRQ
jgi:catechol 2,3-dioxygenase-like lactoylglutathione lyase family enzyme